MRAIQQARFTHLALFIVAVLVTPVQAQGPGASPTAAKEADKHQNQAQTHEMKKMDHRPMQMEMANEGIFEGTGEVIALLPDKAQIVVKHQEIVGFMAAMTMGYAVQSTSLLDGLQPGDVVKFKIDAAKKKIIAIETIP